MTTKKDIVIDPGTFTLTKANVLESFDAWTYTKGEGYFRAHAVVSWEVIKSGIKGKVEGSWAPYYTTKLHINNGRLFGNCSCPVGSDCKHCVALALQWLDDYEDNEAGGNKKQHKNYYENNQLTRTKVSGEEHEPQVVTVNKLTVPAKLRVNPFQDANEYLQSLSRSDLENLASYFIKEFTKTQKIMVFSPDFITTMWRSHLTRLDDDFNDFKTSRKATETESPLMILEQIKDDDARKKCIEVWFEGYSDLINQIKIECGLRGMLDKDEEEIYEYYKNEEYDRAEAEILEKSSERYGESYRSWDYDDDYLEPYEDFDLDNLSLKSYLEDFFSWILAPVQDFCEYISFLHQYGLEAHIKFLVKEGLQWLKDLKPPTKDLGINPKNISALQDLKSVIISKLSVLTKFSSNTDQLDFLLGLFAENPSQRNSEVIWTQFHRMTLTEQNTQYFNQKMLKDYEHSPKWEKFDLLKRLIYKYVPKMLTPFLNASIGSLFKNPDVGLVIKEIFGILEVQPIDTILAIESALLQSSLKVPTKIYGGSTSIYRKTIDWLVSYYSQRNMSERAFARLVELAKTKPKAFEFSHYQTLKKLLPSLTEKFIPEFESATSVILQKGSKDVSFRLLIDLGKVDEACEMIKTLSTSTYSYLHHHDTQWGAITRLLPHLSSIKDKNKELMVKILKAQITEWLTHSSRNRPDASIAEAIMQIRMIHLTFKMRDGSSSWQKWFKFFSNNHWRLRNLRSALKERGIEMKKS